MSDVSPIPAVNRAPNPTTELAQQSRLACSICTHPQGEQIDELIQQGTPIGRIAIQFKLNRGSLTRHRQHAIVRLGQFDPVIPLVANLQQLDSRFRSAWLMAGKLKSASLYSEVLKQQTLLCSKLVELQQQRKVTPGLTQEPTITEQEARKALEQAGYQRVTNPKPPQD